ncbi:MAG: CvpA family protein [Gammaproteobacteria bacterium]|nr:CvpA family protein [Gammaproteobacteria bacterium]
MNGLDAAIVVIITLFVAVGALRGFLSEVFSFLTWTLSLAFAWFFSGDFTGWFAGRIHDADLRSVLVFFALFFVAFIVMTILSHFVRTLWLEVGPLGVDRALGAFVGFLKGAGVIVILVLLAGLTPFPKYHFWRSSLFVGYFQVMAIHVTRWLPPDVARNVRYG